jgi:hypothetical protein
LPQKIHASSSLLWVFATLMFSEVFWEFFSKLLRAVAQNIAIGQLTNNAVTF